jgi:alcohol dehydrogenase, propanol-preferring
VYSSGIRRNTACRGSSAAIAASDESPLPIFETVLRGHQVIGSLVGTREDLAEVFELHAGGRTHVELETRRLEQINEAFDEVLAGKVPARLVLDLR